MSETVETLEDRLHRLTDRKTVMIAENWPEHKIEAISAEIEHIQTKLEKKQTTRLLPGVPGYSDRRETVEANQ